MDVEARLGLLMQGFKVRVDCVLGPGPEGFLQQRREVVQLVREVGEPEHGDNIIIKCHTITRNIKYLRGIKNSHCSQKEKDIFQNQGYLKLFLKNFYTKLLLNI